MVFFSQRPDSHLRNEPSEAVFIAQVDESPRPRVLATDNPCKNYFCFDGACPERDHFFQNCVFNRSP